MILMGIDIGAGKNSALSVYNSKTRGFYEIKSGTIFYVLERVKFWYKKFDSNVIVVVEDNTLNRNVFNQWKPLWEKCTLYFYKRIGTVEAIKKQFNMALKRGQDIGKNKYLCKIFVKELEALGIPHIRVSPSDRWRADKNKSKGGLVITPSNLELYQMPTKLTSAQFKTLTGYSNPTNEHERDASTIVYGKTMQNLLYIGKKHFGLKRLGFI